MSRRNNIIIAVVTGIAFILFVIFVYQPYASKQNQKNKFTDAIQKSYILKDPVAKVPPFSLTDQNGRTITNQDLNGKVYTADFIYTSCKSSCPMITKDLSAVHHAINKSEPFRMLSFSLDPERDTVPALKSFAEKYNAIDSIWFFLTGPKNIVNDLAQNGYMQSVSGYDTTIIAHSEKVVLVDKQGMIRGFYNGLDSIEMQLLIRDINYLLFRDVAKNE